MFSPVANLRDWIALSWIALNCIGIHRVHLVRVRLRLLETMRNRGCCVSVLRCSVARHRRSWGCQILGYRIWKLTIPVGTCLLVWAPRGDIGHAETSFLCQGRVIPLLLQPTLLLRHRQKESMRVESKKQKRMVKLGMWWMQRIEENVTATGIKGVLRECAWQGKGARESTYAVARISPSDHTGRGPEVSAPPSISFVTRGTAQAAAHAL